MNPSTGMAGCCARAASGHAAAAPPSSVMNSRRFIAMTQTPTIIATIAGQDGASQQKRLAHDRFGSWLRENALAGADTSEHQLTNSGADKLSLFLQLQTGLNCIA